jgi:hypothetical protein
MLRRTTAGAAEFPRSMIWIKFGCVALDLD